MYFPIFFIIIIFSTIILGGIPFGINKAENPGRLISQVITVPSPAPDSKSLQAGYIDIQSIFDPPPLTPGADGKCTQTPPNSLSEIQSALSGYRFILSYDLTDKSNPLIPNPNLLQKAQSIYKTICTASASSKWQSLVHGPTNDLVGIYINNKNDCIDDSEYNPGTGPVPSSFPGLYYAYVAMGCDVQTNDYVNRYNLMHELGHVVENRNPDVYSYFHDNIWKIDDIPPLWACLYHSYDPPGHPNPEECFPDLQGEYLTYNVWRSIYCSDDGQHAGKLYNSYILGDTFQEYPYTYQRYYNFIENHIFGGVTFKYDGPKGGCPI